MHRWECGRRREVKLLASKIHEYGTPPTEIASPRRETNGETRKRTWDSNAQQGSNPQRVTGAVKVHFIFKHCGDITQSAAFSMRLCILS
ncbi:unnamed protein product [Lasius platythorax]|uniref:Uncharacterized protein n=1 Tax=Lasius platythorax TaxID=488582 RepID=A0AAV2NDQ5_9HYME